MKNIEIRELIEALEGENGLHKVTTYLDDDDTYWVKLNLDESNTWNEDTDELFMREECEFKVGDIVVGITEESNRYTITTSEAIMRVIRVGEGIIEVEVLDHKDEKIMSKGPFVVRADCFKLWRQSE